MGQAVVVVLLFCAASSSVYILNDIIDRERDRYHPTKRTRPLVQGTVSLHVATFVGTVLFLISILGGLLLPLNAWYCLLLYLAINIAYTFFLKSVVLIDAMCIALGFIMRLLSGVYAVYELPTTWILLCSLFLTLFLGFNKRRAELLVLDPAKQNLQRPSLTKYSGAFLDSLTSSTGTMAVICYALFSTSSGRNPTLIVTVPFVYYAIARYDLLVRRYGNGEEPERVLLADRNIQLTCLLWLLSYLAIVYGEFDLVR